LLRSIAEHRYTPILQGLLLFGVVWAFFAVRNERLYIESFYDGPENNLLFRYAFAIDFGLAFLLSLTFSHLLFFRTIFASKEMRPRWHMPLLRFIDYIWYIGSAFTIFLALSAFQSRFASVVLEENRNENQRLHSELIEKFDQLFVKCQTPLAPIEQNASDELRSAYTIGLEVCGYENAKVDREGIFYDTTIGQDCEPLIPEIHPRSGRWTLPKHSVYTPDLRARSDVLALLEHIRRVCGNIHDLEELDTSTVVLQAMRGDLEWREQQSDWIRIAGHEPGYFRWIAFLIALRLVKTSFEFSEAWREARQVKENSRPQRPSHPSSGCQGQPNEMLDDADDTRSGEPPIV
jgi:hypothetical protein